MKPILLVSKCLTFYPCRFSGEVIPDKVVELLKPFIKFIPVCPEMEIGLSIPRKQLSLFSDSLIEHDTNRNLTDDMIVFSDSFLSGVNDLDGFISMCRSPCCSLYSAKVYDKNNVKGNFVNGAGLFARKVIKKFPNIPKEERGRIENYRIREDFLTKVFLLRNFKDRVSLEDFHRRNKFLLMSFSRDLMKRMGRLVSENNEKEYEKSFYKILTYDRNISSMVDVFTHIYGFFKDKVSVDEKKFILDLIEDYRKEKAPYSEVLGILKDWAIRFNDDYILSQTIFEPFPKELELITDSGKGRKI